MVVVTPRDIRDNVLRKKLNDGPFVYSKDYATPASSVVTTGLQAWLDDTRSNNLLLADGPYLTENLTLSRNNVRLFSAGSLKMNSESGITSAKGLFEISGNDNVVELEIDHNSYGKTGVLVSGDRNWIVLTSKNLSHSADSLGYESGIIITGDYNTVLDLRCYDHDQNGYTGSNVPRGCTIQSGAIGNRVLSPRFYNCNGGVTLGTCYRTQIDDFYADVMTDNGIYSIPDCSDLTVDGFFYANGEEPIAASGTRVIFKNGLVIDSGPYDFENVTDYAVFDNMAAVSTNRSTAATNFMTTKSANVTTDKLILRNCWSRIGLANNILGLTVGAVTFMELENCYFHGTFNDNTTLASAQIAKLSSVGSYRIDGLHFDIHDAVTGGLSSNRTVQLPASPTSWQSQNMTIKHDSAKTLYYTNRKDQYSLSGTNYRIHDGGYSAGYVEQWGVTGSISANSSTTVTLPFSGMLSIDEINCTVKGSTTASTYAPTAQPNATNPLTQIDIQNTDSSAYAVYWSVRGRYT